MKKIQVNCGTCPLPDSLPRTRRSGRGKPITADRRCGVRYPKVDVDGLEGLGVLEGPRDALHLAVARLDDPRVELALDGEREGGRQGDQANEDREEFHLATLLLSPRSLTATDHARQDLWITSASRNDRLSFTPTRLIATPSSSRRPGEPTWKIIAWGRDPIDHSLSITFCGIFRQLL